MKLKRFAPLLMLALSSCATDPVARAVVEGPKLKPAPEAVMVKRSANYQQRLCEIWNRLSSTQTEMCANLDTLKK